MRTESYKCDGPGCDRVKGVANHWWLGIKAQYTLLIKPWTDPAAGAHGVLHLCGESCAQKTLSEFMSDPYSTNQPRANGRSDEGATTAGQLIDAERARQIDAGDEPRCVDGVGERAEATTGKLARTY